MADPMKDLADSIRKLAETNQSMLAQLMGAGQNVSQPQRPSNLPGYPYMLRVNAAFTNALAAVTENYNDSWSRMKDGKYTFGDCVKAWAIAYDTYYDFGTELLKGPAAADRIEWVHFSYVKKGKGGKATPDVLKTVANLGRTCSLDAQLDKTPMANLGPAPSEDLMEQPQWTDNLRRDQVAIELDVTKVDTLTQAGHYIGFVLEKGSTGAPPLVVVMLHVS